MKFINNIFFSLGFISKYKAFAGVVRPAFCLGIEPVMEAFYGSVNSREKLQIIYANLRV